MLKKLFAKLPMARSTRAYEFGLKRVDKLPTGPVLEIGTGQGFGAAYLSRALTPRQIVAIDVTYKCFKPHKLEFGASRPWFVQASAPYLPFAQNAFALITAIMTFHCLPQPKRVFAEVFRTLKPGGIFLLADVDGTHRIAPWFERVEHWGGISPITRAYSPDEIIKLGAEAGFAPPQTFHRKPNGFMIWYIFRKQ